MPRASRGHTEAARKVWPHSESGGPTSPHPTTQAIAHPPFWPFSAGRFWDGGVGELIFARGCARGIPRALGVRSQSLAPFRVRLTNFAPPPHRGYSTPLVWAIFRWGFGRGPSGGLFWACLCPVVYDLLSYKFIRLFIWHVRPQSKLAKSLFNEGFIVFKQTFVRAFVPVSDHRLFQGI